MSAKKLLIAIFLILPVFLSAEAVIKFTTYETAAKYIGNGKPVMLEIGAESCVNCKEMNRILAPIMAKHPNYQIFDILLKAPVVNILNPRPQVKLEDKLNIHAIPVQIFYDGKGKEVYRHTGILTSDQLYTVFRKMGF